MTNGIMKPEKSGSSSYRINNASKWPTNAYIFSRTMNLTILFNLELANVRMLDCPVSSIKKIKCLMWDDRFELFANEMAPMAIYCSIFYLVYGTTVHGG